MPCHLSHERLEVYQRMLTLAGNLHAWLDGIDSCHAFSGHLRRGLDSALESIAAANASVSGSKESNLIIGMGSVLECAACLDIAQVRDLWDAANWESCKNELAGIYRMLIGLRKAWGNYMVGEEEATYSAVKDKGRKTHFAHEDLRVYQLALELASWLWRKGQASPLSAPAFRRLDVLSTSIVLNIAEGNGRFSSCDQNRFLDISLQSAIKLAAQLDLCRQRKLMGLETEDGKEMIGRIVRMTSKLIDTEKG